MAMKESVEETLMKFLQSRLEPFSVSGLLEFLGEPVNFGTEDDLSSFLIFNQLAYVNPGLDGKNELWITRAGLFTGKPLVITPAKSEILSGILIPGSRCVPFANPALLPHDLSFYNHGRLLPRVVLECKPDEVYTHYQLYGDEYIPQYLSLDNEENSILFNQAEYDDPSVISLSVVDMRDFYWSTGFKPGDRIVAHLEDWKTGVFELTALGAEHFDLKKQALWMNELEESLVHSFEIAGPGASMDEQLSFAYFLGLDSLFTPYACSIAEFLRWSKRVQIEPYGVESRLWLTDQSIPSQGSWIMTLVISPCSMAEEAFMHLALPLSEHIMDSYILDMLFCREDSVPDLMERMVPTRLNNAAFCLPVIERSVKQRIKKLTASYNWFADHEPGVLRNRCVTLHSALMNFILFLQQSGIDPDLIADQGAVILGQLMSHTIAALENIDFSDSDEPLDVETLWISIEGMEDSFFETKTNIQEAMPELNKKRFSLIKKKVSQDE